MISSSISSFNGSPRPPECSALVLEPTKRIIYCNHLTRTVTWLPPLSWWSELSSNQKLPYGWECAVDSNNQTYYINHVAKATSYQSPINEHSNKASVINECRTVTLYRETEIGFGFVVGSEKPVIVRCVTKNGPSDGKLQSGDQILTVNGTNVQNSPREQVISLIKSSPKSVEICVKQPSFDVNGVMRYTSSSSKSSDNSKDAQCTTLKPKQSRVRFAESVHVDEPTLFSQSNFSDDSIKPPVTISANILKVFLENGQTKSFKYDATTTVQNVLDSLASKLCLESTEYFGLLTETTCYRNEKRTKSNLLNPIDSLLQLASRPGAHKFKCLFRIAYVPSSPSFLAQKDRHAFDYFYRQCCNDVLKEKFHPELDRDTTLHLAALQIYQQALTTATNYSVTVKSIEKHDFYDLSHFVPRSLLDSLKRKELVRIIKHYLKMYISTSSTASLPKKSGKTLTVFQAKLLYLDIIAQLPSYGAKCFNIVSVPNTMASYQTNTVLIISPKFGISQVFTELGINSLPTKITGLDEIEKIRLESVADDDTDSGIICNLVKIFLINDRFIDVLMECSDAQEFSLVLKGLCLVLYAKKINILSGPDNKLTKKPPVGYFEEHSVLPEKWSYYQLENKLEHISFANIPEYQSYKYSSGGSLLFKDLLNGKERQLEVEAARLIADSESYLKTSASISNGLAESTFPTSSLIENPTNDDVIDLTDETNGSDLLLSGDFSNMNLDDFLEKVIVAPPDSFQSSFENRNDSLELTLDEIKKFIIPPPPLSSSSSNQSDDNDDHNQISNQSVKERAKKFEQGTASSSSSTSNNNNCSNCCQKQNDSEDEDKDGKHSSTIDHLLKKTIFVLDDLLKDINVLSNQCVMVQQYGGGHNRNEALFQTAKNELMTETLNLVTTSKTLIITMSDMANQSQQMAEHLATCLTIIRMMYNLSAQMVEYMSVPLQTRNLIVRFINVIDVFKRLLDLSELNRSSQQSIEEFLAARAEELANTLANLLRSLRIFT